jgi:hypothetical protein
MWPKEGMWKLCILVQNTLVFIWVWNVVSYVEGRTQITDVFEKQMPRKMFWANKGEVSNLGHCITRTLWHTYYLVSSLCVHTSSEAHPASYPVGTGGPSPGVMHGQGVMLTTHSHLVLRSRMSRSYTLPLVACMAVAGQLYFTDRLVLLG